MDPWKVAVSELPIVCFFQVSRFWGLPSRTVPVHHCLHSTALLSIGCTVAVLLCQQFSTYRQPCTSTAIELTTSVWVVSSQARVKSLLLSGNQIRELLQHRIASKGLQDCRFKYGFATSSCSSLVRPQHHCISLLGVRTIYDIWQNRNRNVKLFVPQQHGD